MADQWYYRMFEQDFGPVSFDELKQLAELGSISADDEVRPSSATSWVTAGTVADLGLSSTRQRSAPTSIAELPVAGSPTGANDWYYMFHGQEMGPIGFEEVVEFAQQGQLEANDEVRLGTTGKWRRVGSIGRLVAVLPYHEPLTPQPTPSVKVTPPAPIEADAAASTGAGVAESTKTPGTLDTALIQAEAAYAASAKAAHSLVAWALAPNMDPAWWGWIGGAERGPVGFVEIYDWAIAGQLQATDYVKNGLYGQYVPLANVPGLLNAVSIVADAKQTLETAKANSAVVAATLAKSNPSMPAVPTPPAPSPAKQSSPQLNAIPAPTAPAKPSNASVATVPTPTPTKAIDPTPPELVAARKIEEPAKPIRASSPSIATPAPTPAAAPRPVTTPSVSSYASAALTPSRPAPVSRPQPKPSRSSSSGPGIGETLKDPKILGGVGAVVLLVCLVFGWQYLPMASGKDVEIYQKSKQLLDDVRAARVAKSTSYDAFKSRAQKLKEEYAPKLKDEANNQRPHKQALLFAIRDEFPRMMSGNLAEESVAEKNVAAHLKIVSDTLGIK